MTPKYKSIRYKFIKTRMIRDIISNKNIKYLKVHKQTDALG